MSAAVPFPFPAPPPGAAVPIDAVVAAKPRRPRAPRPSRERARAELARRRAVADGVLATLPRPGGYAAKPGRRGTERADLWPPPPELPARAASRDGNTYTPELLRGLIREFAATRGEDFGVVEFARWSGVCTATLYRHLGRWPAARAAAGLPARPRRPDRRRETLHALLELLYRNELAPDAPRRRRPLTARELGDCAGVSAACVNGHGGIGNLRGLAVDWVHMWERRDLEGDSEAPKAEVRRDLGFGGVPR